MFDAFDAPAYAAFANHLVFLAAHRGALRSDDTGIWLDGAEPGLSCWTPWPATRELPAACPAVRLGPIADAAWPARLATAGFAPAERLSYMELDALPTPATAPAAASIEIARTDAALREFAAVQAAGFATGDVTVDAWWAPFFEQVALRNRSARNQTFYLARMAGKPAATTLLLHAAGVAGIYAVATIPNQRGRGLARALLQRACTDAGGSGTERIVLQALTGSYAERYYARLGFRTTYELQVWRRAAAQA